MLLCPHSGVVERMKFIAPVTFRGKTTRHESVMDWDRWTPKPRRVSRTRAGTGCPDSTFDAPGERAAMAVAPQRRDVLEAGALVAVPADEASVLVE